MGRLTRTRDRVLLTCVLLVGLPVAVLTTARLTASDGAPALSLTAALVVAHLLSVGPRGAPLAVYAFALHGLVVADADPGLALVAVASVQAGLAVGVVRLLERQFARHGPVRSTRVLLDFGVLVGALLPLLVAAASALLGPALGTVVWPGAVVHHALADGIGVLGVTAGIRMLVMGERPALDRSGARAAVAAALVTVAAVLVAGAYADVETVASSQVLVLPVLLVALLLGTAAYAIAAALTVLGVAVPAAVLDVGAAATIPTSTQAVWWVVALVGLLLATDGDRRRATNREFQAFFMRSTTPTATVNATTGKVTRANEAVARLLGVEAATLEGRPATDLVRAAPDAGAAIRRVLRREVLEAVVEAELSAGADTRWLRCVASFVDLGGPQHDVVQVQLVDLTAERDRQDALERSNHALERFGRRVTHDLKQPLSAVAAYASTLVEHADRLDREVVISMYERLEIVSQRAVRELDEAFAAATSSDDSSGVVNLGEVVASVVAVAEIDLNEAQGTVDTSLAVPVVRADPSLLRQVLLNLVTNSLKYAAPDTPPRIRVASRVRGNGVEITVTDNGSGIPVDELDTVFDRGRRLDPDRAQGGGHGLADSRALAVDAGGWLRAEPWPAGARFVLWLPDASVADAHAVTRVLLVDDEHDELSLLRRQLDLQDCVEVVGTATSIPGAVAATRDLRPDVVLLDRWLRDEDGMTGVIQLARAHPEVRIILLTDELTEQLQREVRAGGVLHALEKNGSVDVVAQVLAEVT